MSGKGKKRSKAYYKKCANVKRTRLNCLEAGLKGFIVTCCDREKEATRESYNILNDFAEQLYGPENCNAKSSDIEDEEEDIEKAMKKEVDAFKDTKLAERRFQRLESKTKNCIFIKTTLETPTELSQMIFQNLLETKVQKTRYAMRLFPVQGTCKANIEEILKLGDSLFEKYFSTPLGEGLSFSILFKARNNNSIGRDSVIPELSHIVTNLNPAHTVAHDKPDYVIFVQILCTICCVSIVKDFFKFKKYNLQEIVKSEDKVANLSTVKEEKTQENITNLIEKEEETKDNITKLSTGKEEVMQENTTKLLSEVKNCNDDNSDSILLKDSNVKDSVEKKSEEKTFELDDNKPKEECNINCEPDKKSP